MRAVLDTNILISGIFWKGTPFKVLDAWINERYELVLSEEILTEYSRTLIKFEKKKKEAKALAKYWILFIAQNSVLVNVKKKIKICRDPFDDMFLSCALAGQAKFVVSGDNDLLSIREYMGIKIIQAKDFLKYFDSFP